MYTKESIERQLKHKERVAVYIEQSYAIKIKTISKWFSVEHVPTEILEREQKITLSNGSVVERDLTIYTEALGRINASRYINNYKTMRKKEIDWNQRETFSDIDPIPFHTGIYEFDSFDNTKHFRCHYTSDGLVTKTEVTDKFGKLLHIEYREYTSNKQLSKIIMEKSGHRSIDAEYRYDSHGNMISADWIDDNGTKKHSESRYNQYNDLIFYDGFFQGKHIVKSFEYFYDIYNNWTECREINDGKLVKVIKRQYKYI